MTTIDVTDLVCSVCQKSLSNGSTTLDCPSCDIPFPFVDNIPDLRPIRNNDEKTLSRIAHLKEAYESSSWKDLAIQLIHLKPDFTPKMRQVTRDYTLQISDRVQERLDRALQMLPVVGWGFTPGTVLELGCGTGGGLGVLSDKFEKVIGLDISHDNLLLARKFIEEKDLKNVILLCGDAEALPLKDKTVDFMIGTDFLHHVPKPLTALKELRRVLKEGGSAALDSSNRFSFFSPEPHVKIWGVGFLPRAWQEGYVRFRLGVSYRERHAHLISIWELIDLLKTSFPKNYRLYSPFLWKKEPKKLGWLIRFIRKRIPWVAHLGHILFLLVMANHEFLIQKK